MTTTMNKTMWGPWRETQGCQVREIRNSLCGKWIEKRYYDAEEADKALDNQQEYGELIAVPGTEYGTYISECVPVISTALQDILFDDIEVGDHDEIWGYKGIHEEDEAKAAFLLDVAHFAKPKMRKALVAEASVVWDHAATAWGDLFFGDMHWGNYGLKDGTLVCIDFDGEHFHGVHY